MENVKVTPETFKKGDKKNFLDYQIVYCTNNDGIVLQKHPDRPQEGYECHLGNYSTLDQAQQAAVLYYMLARPEHFATSLYYRCMGRGGSHLEYLKLKKVIADEGYELPDEITPFDSMNMFVGYKGKQIIFPSQS